LNQLSLHLGSEVLVELELFDDQVEVVHESLFDVFPDVVVESGLDMVWFVRLLNLLDPHIQRIQLLFDQIVEVVLCVEDTVDRAHQEREESKAHEFKDDREDVLPGGSAEEIAVSYGGDDFKDPVEGKDILGVQRFVVEVVFKNPGFNALFVIGSCAVFKASQEQPEASVDVADVNDGQDQNHEGDEVVLSFLGVL
jgi:hypothetical protein